MREKSRKTTTKILAIVGISLCSLLVLIAFTGRYFGQPFYAVGNFFLGSFGISFYGLMAGVIVACSFVLAGKKVIVPIPYIVNFAFMFLIVVMLVHTYSTVFLGDYNFSEYARIVFDYYGNLPTFGGVVWGCIAFAFQKALTIWGSSIVLWLGLLTTAFFAGKFFVECSTGKLQSATADKQPESEDNTSNEESSINKAALDTTPMRSEAYTLLFEDRHETVLDEEPNPIIKQGLYENYSNYESKPSVKEKDDTKNTDLESSVKSSESKKNSFDYDDFIVKSDSVVSDNSSSRTFPQSVEQVFFSDNSYNQQSTQNQGGFGSYGNDESRQSDYNNTQSSAFGSSQQFFNQTTSQRQSFGQANQSNVSNNGSGSGVSEFTSSYQSSAPQQGFQQADQNSQQPVVVPPQTESWQTPVDEQPLSFEKENTTFEPQQPVVAPVEKSVTKDNFFIQSNTEPAVEEKAVKEEPSFTSTLPEEDKTEVSEPQQRYTVKEVRTAVPGGVQMGFDVVKEDEQKPVHHYIEYQTPPLDLLNEPSEGAHIDMEYIANSANAIVKKLGVFGIQVEAVEPVVGPTVTQFRFRPISEKTQMKEFYKYDADLKSCLEATGGIRIEAPIPGTNLVGVEVANKKKVPVMLRTIMESNEYRNAKGNLLFVLGQEITGRMVIEDLAEKPHLLIAGTTGSGKSVALNTMIVSMMYRYSPEYVRFLMVDPKMVELSKYSGCPHLLTSETIINVQDALSAMDYLINEMEARYKLFKEARVDNISSYNKSINPETTQKLPYIIFVVDELSDLMSTSKKAMESKILRLAQKSRAAGIHLVLATQRPSKDVITGTIKGNLPCRVALKVASYPDSGVIIGCGGAEKLLGNGDMLFMDSKSDGLLRLQGPYVSNKEILALVDYNKAQNEVYYEDNIAKQIFTSLKEEEVAEEAESAEKEITIDPYCRKALRYWLEKNSGMASMSSLQRGLNVGFNRAGRIMEILTNLGYIEGVEASESGNKKRKVLVTLEQLSDIFPDLDDNY